MGPARPNSAISRLMETARLRQDGDGASQNVTPLPAWPARPKSATSRLSRQRWRRRCFHDQGGDDAIKTKISRGFCDWGGDGANLATKMETARLKLQRRDWPGWRDQKLLSPDFRDQGEDGPTFQNKWLTDMSSIGTGWLQNENY